MGEAGRQRAQAVYDWKPIIGQYEALWAKQTELRLAAKAKDDKSGKPLAHPWPARMDPFHAFASYPTQALTPQMLLALVDANAQVAVQLALAYRQLAMVDFAKLILPSEASRMSSLTSSTVTDLPATKVRSTAETLGVGTRMAEPSSLPASSGSARGWLLAVAVALAAGGVWVLYRRRATDGQRGGGRSIVIEETRSLGNRQYLVIAACDGRRFLLGVTPGRIELVAPLDQGKPEDPS
jgi:flagellar protein FliO/FliZ